MVECPSCGEFFDTERGVNLHHSRSHDESLTKVSKDCCICGSEIVRNKSQFGEHAPTCSDSCQYEKMSRERSEQVKLTCDECNTSFKRQKSQVNEGSNYCSQACSHSSRSKKVILECDICGTSLERPPSAVYDTNFCSYQCYGKYQRRDEPIKRRLGDWSKKRRLALERANHTCEHPSCERNKSQSGRSLQVHHIIPNELTDIKQHNLENLLVLCKQHHDEIEPPKHLCR